MLPPFVVIALGVEPTRALVISQVVLSIALPLPMISLTIFTSKSDIMGAFTNRPLTHAIAICATGLVLALNIVLIWQSLS